MRALNILLMACAVGGAYYYQTHHYEAAALSTANGSSFVDVPSVEGAVPGKVMVIAAKNCGKEDAKRADALARDLEAKGVPVNRTNELRVTVSSEDSPESAQNLQNVMGGPLPAVIVDGRASSNPTLAEVMAEVKRGAN